MDLHAILKEESAGFQNARRMDQVRHRGLTTEEARLRPPPQGSSGRTLLRRLSSDASMRPRRRSSLYADLPQDEEDALDLDDPQLKALQQLQLVHLHRRERRKARTMPYRERRKYTRRAKILFNPDSEC